jgi:translation initiation factor IF-3
MFLFLAPKKAAQAKKSQQKMDRERREAEAKEASKQQAEVNEVEAETPANGGLFANIKGGEEVLKKLQDSNEE